MKIFLSIYKLLNFREKLKFFFLIFISLVATILETMSLGLLIPLFTNLFNSSNQISSVFYFIDFSIFENKFNSFFNLQSLLIIIIIIYIFKNIFLAFVIFWSNKFTSEISIRLSYKLFKNTFRILSYHKNTEFIQILTIMSLVHILLELLLVIFIFIKYFQLIPMSNVSFLNFNNFYHFFKKDIKILVN